MTLYACHPQTKALSRFAVTPQLKSLGHHRHALDLIALRPATNFVAGPRYGFYPVAVLIQAGLIKYTLRKKLKRVHEDYYQTFSSSSSPALPHYDN